MAVAKPTIVIVPGAGHSPMHYKELATLLQQAGYPVSSPALPSINPQVSADHSSATDADFLRECILLRLLEDGRRHLAGHALVRRFARRCSC